MVHLEGGGTYGRNTQHIRSGRSHYSPRGSLDRLNTRPIAKRGNSNQQHIHEELLKHVHFSMLCLTFQAKQLLFLRCFQSVRHIFLVHF